MVDHLDGGGEEKEGARTPRGIPLREGHQGGQLYRLREQGVGSLQQHGQRKIHPKVFSSKQCFGFKSFHLDLDPDPP